jgi:hypothetical protein
MTFMELCGLSLKVQAQIKKPNNSYFVYNVEVGLQLNL